MAEITASWRPYWLDPNQVPKWGALAALAVLTALTGPAAWWAWSLLGIVLYFPQEYLFHRGIFHRFADEPAGEVLSKMHVLHHKEPERLRFMWVPPILALPLGAIYLGLYLVLAWVLGAPNPMGIAASVSLGNFAGLQLYEWFHFQAHRPARPWTPWGRFIKRLHLLHHYKNEGYWYGVSWGGVLGDALLGTYRSSEDVERSGTVRDLGLPDRYRDEDA